MEKEKSKRTEKKTENKTEEKKVTARKRAADFYSGDEGEDSDGGWDKLHADEAKTARKQDGAAKKAAAGKKGKVLKKAKIDAAPAAKKEEAKKPGQEEKQEKAITKRSKKAKAPASDDEISLHSDSELEAENALNGEGSDLEKGSADEEDDQTTTLLKGFESSDDEEEPEDVTIVAVKNKEFRNLTIPDVKQKIASRSNKKVLPTLNTPIVNLQSRVDIWVRLPVPLRDTSTWDAFRTASTSTRCVPTSLSLELFSVSAFHEIKRLDAQNTMPSLNSLTPKSLPSFPRQWITTYSLDTS